MGMGMAIRCSSFVVRIMVYLGSWYRAVQFEGLGVEVPVVTFSSAPPERCVRISI